MKGNNRRGIPIAPDAVLMADEVGVAQPNSLFRIYGLARSRLTQYNYRIWIRGDQYLSEKGIASKYRRNIDDPYIYSARRRPISGLLAPAGVRKILRAPISVANSKVGRAGSNVNANPAHQKT